MNNANLTNFLTVYKKHLIANMVVNPTKYRFSTDAVPAFLEKLKIALGDKSYNKDGDAFKATCKELKIKYTYGGINEFLENT